GIPSTGRATLSAANSAVPKAAKSQAEAQSRHRRPNRLARWSLRALLDVCIYFPLEKRQRQRAETKDRIVIVLERKAIAKTGSGPVAQLGQLQLAEHICAGLSRIHNIPFHFARLDAVVDALLSRPVLGVDSCIHDEAP